MNPDSLRHPADNPHPGLLCCLGLINEAAYLMHVWIVIGITTRGAHDDGNEGEEIKLKEIWVEMLKRLDNRIISTKKYLYVNIIYQAQNFYEFLFISSTLSFMMGYINHQLLFK